MFARSEQGIDRWNNWPRIECRYGDTVYADEIQIFCAGDDESASRVTHGSPERVKARSADSTGLN